MLGRLFPESLFPRKLDPTAERRIRLAQARAEESVIRAHVDNALMFVDTLAEDLAFDRAIDTYIRVMGIPEPLASTVATRTLVVLGQDLVPYRRRARDGDPGEDDSRPKLRLDDASDGRSRIRRASRAEGGWRKAEGGRRMTGTGNREPGTGNREPGTGNYCSQLRAARWLPGGIGSSSQRAAAACSRRLPASSREQRASSCWQRAAALGRCPKTP
jgi:hypothetical protein